MAGQIWATNSLGGFLSAKNLSKKLRFAVQPMAKFRQFCDIKDASQQGKKKGDTFTWDVFSDVSTRGTTLVETNTMPETNFTITQGTLSVTEYGNAVPYTGKMEDLSELDVMNIINKVLRFDAARTLDAAAFTQFNETKLRVVSSNTTAITLTTDGTASATNSLAFQQEHVGLIVDTMKERNIPPYEMDDYFAIARPTTLRTLKNDLQSIHSYLPEGYQLIKAGEVGKFEGCRFVEQTNIPKGGAADASTFNAFTNVAEAWDNLLSDWIFFIGADTVGEGIVVPEEVRGKLPGDYGRSKGVAWYYLGGFGISHTAADQSRIVKWDSAS